MAAGFTSGEEHPALNPLGFDTNHSREPNFIATFVVADPGGAWPEAELYSLGKDHFRIVPNGDSDLPEGECTAVKR